jgi:hypothetical protein
VCVDEETYMSMVMEDECVGRGCPSDTAGKWLSMQEGIKYAKSFA